MKGPAAPSGLQPAARYAIAAGVSVAALLLCWALRSLILPDDFSLLLAAVVISAWIGGLGTGLLATLLCAVPSAVSLPHAELSHHVLLHAVSFLLVSLLTSALCEALHQARRQAEAERARVLVQDAVVRATEERLRTILHNLPVALFAADADWTITYADGKVFEAQGYRREDLIGRSALERFSKAEWLARDGRRALQGDAFIGGGPVEDRWYENHYQPLRGERKEISGFICLSIDVTERRRMEQERADLLQREKAARAAAEAAGRRASFLAQASTLLDASLDYPTTLASMACLAVPHVGDWCVIDLLEEDGGLRRLAVVHADPRKGELAKVLCRRYAPGPHDPYGVPSVLRNGRPLLVPRVEEDEIRARLGEDGAAEHLALLREMGFASYMCVPFLARGRTLGAITFVRGPAGAAYGPVDLSLAEDLAHRSAIAVDTAQLYHQAQAQGGARLLRMG